MTQPVSKDRYFALFDAALMCIRVLEPIAEAADTIRPDVSVCLMASRHPDGESALREWAERHALTVSEAVSRYDEPPWNSDHQIRSVIVRRGGCLLASVNFPSEPIVKAA